MSASDFKLGVLISGGGRTALNLHDRIQDGTLDARITIAVSSREEAVGVDRVRSRGITTHVLERDSLSADEFDERIGLLMAGVDLVCMCGFLSLWRIPSEFMGRVINIHPALLPAHGGRGMYGLRVHEAVIAAGERESGCTVHFCDNEFDRGPIILQRRVPVLATDDPRALAARVFAAECEAYPEAIRIVQLNRSQKKNALTSRQCRIEKPAT
jgi:formyltetrahydrofolate-dependent phosphoribosylglycinamide formyltransferase